MRTCPHPASSLGWKDTLMWLILTCPGHIPGSRMGLEGSQHPLDMSGLLCWSLLPLHWPCLEPWGFSRVKPQGGSHWTFWLVYVRQMAQCKVRDAASMDLVDEHNSWVCPIPAPALFLCCLVACEVVGPVLPFPSLRGFSILQKATLKALHFPQLLLGVCISSGPFSLRVMRGLSIK